VDARNQKQMEKGNSPFILGLGQQAMRGMLPTPRTADAEGGCVKNVQMENGNYFRTNKEGVRWGVKLRDVVESGMLPTPNASDWNTGTKPETYEARRQRHAEKGVNLQMTLRQMAVMLPTPTAMDSTNATATMKSTQVKEGSMHSVTLTRAMSMGMLPTPKAMEAPSASWENRKPNSKFKPGVTLTDLKVWGMLPTPQAQEGEKITGLENQDSMTKRVRQITGTTSQLNPRFVGEMMGFPPNWTELPFQSGEQNPSKDTETQ